MPSGGYRKPTNPAPVSGPGKLSQRTDGGPADKRMLTGGGEYGESKDLAGLQTGAPGAPTEQGRPEANPIIPLDAPSRRPDEPVTTGAALGEGPGTEMLGLSEDETLDLQDAVRDLPWLEYLASRPGASASVRSMVRRIKAAI